MTTMRWFPSGATPRGVPALRRVLPRRPVALLALAAALFSLTGCQSGPCGPCSPVSTGWRNFRETVSRPFRHGRTAVVGSSPCCGPEMGVEGAPIVTGSPTVIGAPAAGSVLPGPTESLPSNLEPIPQASPGPAPSSSPSGSGDTTGSKSPNGKTSYEAFRPRFDDANRSDSLARSTTPSPEPTTRSAQGSRPLVSTPSDSSLLDNLPPLDLPKDLTRNDSTPPVAPAAEAERRPTATPEPVAEASLPPSGAVPPPAADTNAAPGIRRFAGVGARLAGGSLPSPAGLDWLVEKGYKTVLDLRVEAEISPSFISEATRRGLRYVALPLIAKSVDADHVSRFEAELSLADGRPLYFCDTDGSRAGVMWYIHRILVDKVDADVARRDAEELGLTDAALLNTARTYIDTQKPKPVEGPAARPAEPAKPTTPPPAAVPAPSTPPAKPTDVPRAAEAETKAPQAPSAGPNPTRSADATPTPAPRDPTAWKPVAAMLVTGLGVPLAYAGATALPTTVKAIARASLPAPRTSQRSLPPSSGG